MLLPVEKPALTRGSRAALVFGLASSVSHRRSHVVGLAFSVSHCRSRIAGLVSSVSHRRSFHSHILLVSVHRHPSRYLPHCHPPPTPSTAFHLATSSTAPPPPTNQPLQPPPTPLLINPRPLAWAHHHSWCRPLERPGLPHKPPGEISVLPHRNNPCSIRNGSNWALRQETFWLLF